MSRRTRLSARASRVGIASLAGVALVAPLAACSSGGDGPRDTLVYASGDAEPTCLDPHVGGNYPQALLATQVLESMVSRNDDGEIVPWLATDWEVSDDGMTWDFTLDADAQFSDGTPVDAAAIKANIEHLQDPETGSSTGYLAVQQIDEVEVVDATHARFTMVRPDAALLESLAQVWVSIQSPAGIERGSDENCLAPIGSGPYVVDEWVKQDRIELSRNPEYATPPGGEDLPPENAVASLTWRFIPDSTARYSALESGQVDIIDNPLPDQITAAEASEDLDHLDAPRPGASNRIELNSGQAPFDDIRVREAFISAVDVDSAVSSLFEDTAERSTSAMSSAEPLVQQSPDSYVFDQDRAGELLDEAGWDERDSDGIRTKDGERLTLRFPVSTNQSVPAEQALFEQLQANAAEAGFEVQISLLDLSSWYEALAQHEYELVSAPYTKIGPDVLRFLYHSDAIEPAPSGYFANAAQISDPELDALLDSVGSEMNPEARATATTAAQERIAELQVILPLYDQQNHFLYRSDLEGFRALPTVSTPWLADVVAGA
ncbi:ABC transporter substrate-binding protein [Leucobacter tardus]|uniref:ABC transporter substrate-binding protein n=1 Tax=Leucobacter tardus TaxID=501483 RepID=A0A939QL41_9MICO|nr:ABC transporter substrate-binding protein [Leucobacter tardus]MBO2989694.1 ABC transporter substrate-binding protein [Leucobacter tardus]